MIITAVYDMEVLTAGATWVGWIYVDGVQETDFAIILPTSKAFRGAVSQVYVIQLTAASHTIKMRGQRITGTGSCTYYASTTGFTYMLVSQ